MCKRIARCAIPYVKVLTGVGSFVLGTHFEAKCMYLAVGISLQVSQEVQYDVTSISPPPAGRSALSSNGAGWRRKPRASTRNFPVILPFPRKPGKFTYCSRTKAGVLRDTKSPPSLTCHPRRLRHIRWHSDRITAASNTGVDPVRRLSQARLPMPTRSPCMRTWERW
jgi:hypothetical protein